LLNPTHVCPKCGEWYFAIRYRRSLWRIYSVQPRSLIAPLRMLMCPADSTWLKPWLIDRTYLETA
jgi:hypothetical protein